MQNPTRIFKQFRPLQNLLAKITTVQKPCIDRAIPDFSGLHNKKNAKSYDLTFNIWCTSRDSNPGPTD